MTTQVECRPSAPDIDELIVRLSRTNDAHEIETIADQLSAARDHRAIRPLLLRLADCQGRENACTEEAVCGALMALGVMCCSCEHSFSLRPRRALPDDVVETIREVAAAIPWPYFGTRRI